MAKKRLTRNHPARIAPLQDICHRYPWQQLRHCGHNNRKGGSALSAEFLLLWHPFGKHNGYAPPVGAFAVCASLTSIGASNFIGGLKKVEATCPQQPSMLTRNPVYKALSISVELAGSPSCVLGAGPLL